MTPATLLETIVVALARDFRDGEVGYTGLTTGSAAAQFATALPLAAMALAQRTHAPNLTIVLCGYSHNPDLRQLDRIPDSEFDESLRDLPCEVTSKGFPNYPWMHKRGDISFGFVSAAQVDATGSVNSVCIGPHDRPTVRLVGPILQPEHMSVFRREYVMMPHHARRAFVEKVDFVSGVGWPGGIEGRRALGLDRGGPELVFTPHAVFDFDKPAGRMRLRSVHGGKTPAEVQDLTGFDLGRLDGVPETPRPSADELDILRRDVDPRRLLLREIDHETAPKETTA